jgi:hypothetical protein
MTGQNLKFIKPDMLKWIIIGLIGFVVLILVFGVGVKVGTLKARYSYRWADNYHKNFAGPRSGFLGDWRGFPAGDFIGGHGAFGEIIEINPSTGSTSSPQASSGQESFVIKGRENVEKVIITNQETTITKGREAIKDGLKVGDRMVIVGSPNEEGQIEAKLIRVFDEEMKQLPYGRDARRISFPQSLWQKY